MILGIDIGGTNTKFGVVDENGKILTQGSITTCENDDPLHFIDRLARALGLIFETHPKDAFKGIGIGAPNGNFYSGAIEHAPNLQWKGVVPLAQLIEKKLGLRTLLTNDANAAAMGEMIYGGARGMKDFIVITLGTGLGSGIVINGEVVYGNTGFAGELGHLTVMRGGRPCGCGRRGCLETYASATGIVRTAEEILRFSSQDSVLKTGAPVTAKMLTEAAKSGDEIALKAFAGTAEILGEALANMAVFSAPEAIFLFGGLAQAGDLLLKPTREHFENALLNVLKNKVKLLPSGLPESDAAILGAAALVR